MLAPGIPFKYLDATMAFFLNKKFNGMLILISLSSTGKMQRKRKRHQFKLPQIFKEMRDKKTNPKVRLHLIREKCLKKLAIFLEIEFIIGQIFQRHYIPQINDISDYFIKTYYIILLSKIIRNIHLYLHIYTFLLDMVRIYAKVLIRKTFTNYETFYQNKNYYFKIYF